MNKLRAKQVTTNYLEKHWSFYSFHFEILRSHRSDEYELNGKWAI